MRKTLKILFSFFNSREKKYLFALILLMLSLAVIELVGVGSIFFYIKLLTNQDIVFQSKHLSFAFRLLGFREIRSFLLFLGGVIFFIMVIRGLLGCLNLYLQARFTAHMRNRLSQEILRSYITMPYVNYLSLNTAVLSKHLLIEVSNVVASISNVLLLLTEAIVACALIVMLLIVDFFLVSFIVLILGGITFGIIKYTRKHISYVARENERCYGLMFKSASQSLSGLKEIKVFNKEKFFQRQFEQPLFKASSLAVRHKVLCGFPGMIMNLMAFGTLLFILLYLLYSKSNLMNALPVIGLMAVSVQRLLPSVNKIYNAIALIRKYEPGVSIIRDMLDKLKTVPKEDFYIMADKTVSLKFEKLIRLCNVSFTYPGSHRKALDNISLEIIRNSAIGIIGSSGAGKSTLVDVLLGLLPVCEGKIYCDDVLLTGINRISFHRLIGYVPQQTFLLDDTLDANIAFGVPKNEINKERLAKAVRIAQLEGLIYQLPQGFDTNIGERGIKLSGGQRQRIGIARALYHDPEILILDEATNSLDLSTEAEFLESLRVLMGKKTLIIIAHRLSSLALCEKLVLIREGKIVACGTLQELTSSSPDFRELYEVFSSEDC